MTMRFSWQGRVVFPGQEGRMGRTDSSLQAHCYVRDLGHSVTPWYFGDSRSRWFFRGAETDAHDVDLTLDHGIRKWPMNLVQAIEQVLHSVVVGGFAVLEWNVNDEAKTPRPQFITLPAWSCRIEGRKLLQLTEGGTEESVIDRGVVISLPSPLSKILEAERDALLELGRQENIAMMTMPARILGASQVNVMGVVDEIAMRLWEATRWSGYPSAAASVQVSPSYLAMRQVRFALFSYRVRRAIIMGINAGVEPAFAETGRRLSLDFDEAWTTEDEGALLALAGGIEADRKRLLEILQYEAPLRR